MRVLSSADVARALPMDVAIAAMKEAFAAVSEGSAVIPQRHIMRLAQQGAFSAFMVVAWQAGFAWERR